MNLSDYDLPEVLTSIPEMYFLFRLSEDFTQIFLQKLSQMSKELDPETASDEGLRRFENMYGITPRPTDTTEERRFRIRISRKVIDVLNFPNLQKLVFSITNGDSTVTQNTKDKTVSVKVGLSSLKMNSIVKKLVSGYVPVCVTAQVLQTYNKYSDYAGRTYSELSKKTWNELREEV